MCGWREVDNVEHLVLRCDGVPGLFTCYSIAWHVYFNRFLTL